MKKIIFFLLLMVSVFSGHSQVQFGTGNNTIQNAPFSPTYWYSYAQSIYLASDINASGQITSLQWYFNGTSPLEYSQDLVVYLGHTPKTVFNSQTDWILPAEMTIVYNGGIIPGGPGWVTIQLQTPFSYNGVDNLVVAVAENTAGRDANSDTFSNTQVNSIRTLATFSNDAAIEVNNPPLGPSSSYVPNIIFDGISQTCSTPMYVKTTDVQPTAVSITWQLPDALPSGGSEYYVSDSNTAPNAGTVPSGSVSTGNTADITSNLLPNTTYSVWVRNSCDEGNKSAWSYPATFITPCSPVTELSENFDGVTLPALPGCWTSIIKGEGVTAGSTIGTNSIFVHSAPNSVMFYGSETVDQFILVSPNLSNLAAGTHRLKFYANESYGPGMLEIGTLNNDGNSESAVFTLYQEVGLSAGINEYIIDFSNYSGTDSYIGIRVPEYSALAINLDNIIWEVLPSCPDINGIAVSGITPNSAVLNWSNAGVENSWEVAVGTIAIANPDDLTPIPTSETSKEIADLLPETEYNVWVRSVCFGNDLGAWIGPVVFKTDCAGIASFNENFEGVESPDLPVCWSKIVRGESVSNYASVYSTFSEMSSAPRAIAFSDDGSFTGNGDDLILVSPRLSTLSLGTYRLKFYAKKSGGNPVTLQVGTLTSNDAAAVFTMVEEITLTDDANLYTIYFNGYTGTNEHIGIRMNSDYSYNYAYVDDVVWEIAPTCPAVSEIAVSEITAHTAFVEWTPSGQESAWDIVYGEMDVTDPGTLTPQASTDPSALIEGLSDATNYKIWVRSSCEGDDKGEWIGPLTFITKCLPVADFYETFDTVTSPALPTCWSALLQGEYVSEGAYINTYPYDTVFSQPNSVILYNETTDNGNDIILISPELSNLSAGTHRLKFYARSQDHPEGAAMEIGTLNSNQPGAAFNFVAAITVTGDVEQYIIDFDSYTGTDTYIGIRMSTELPHTRVAIDDVVWEIIPACPDVTDIEVVATTASTATLNWAEEGEEASWDIVWGLSTINIPTEATNSATATTTGVTISELSGNTTYKAWVRSSCGADEKGTWMGPIAFTTDCDPTNVPYIENFETAENYEVPVCTDRVNQGNGNQWYVNENPGYGFLSKTLIYMYNYQNNANAWFFTRGVNLTANTAYTISYSYGSASYGSESLKVMYGTSPDVNSMTNLIGDYPSFTSPIPNEEAVTFTPSVSGVYYFGFNAYSISNQNNIYVDNIKVDVALSTTDPEWNDFTYYPNPVEDLLNLSYTENITSVTVYNLLGQEVLVKAFNDNLARIDFSALSSGTYMVKVVSNQTSKTIKVIKK